MKRDNAFTGLEAAIVLIAFVVVAAIFSYVMLGAGFFATQKAQEVTYSSIKQTTSNIVPDGIVYGNVSDQATGKIDLIQFALSVPVGGQTQEFSQILLTYSKEGMSGVKNFVWSNTIAVDKPVTTTLTAPGAGQFAVVSCTGDFWKEGQSRLAVPPGNTCDIIVNLGTTDNPISGQWFQLEIKSPAGAPTTLKRTIPTGYMGGKLT